MPSCKICIAENEKNKLIVEFVTIFCFFLYKFIFKHEVGYLIRENLCFKLNAKLGFQIINGIHQPHNQF